MISSTILCSWSFSCLWPWSDLVSFCTQVDVDGRLYFSTRLIPLRCFLGPDGGHHRPPLPVIVESQKRLSQRSIGSSP